MKDDSPKMIKFTDRLDRFITWTGEKTAWLIAVLIVVILFQVILRYMFHKSYVFIEEIQWHLYAVVIMMGLSYSFTKDSHIRLDILHANFSKPKKEIIDIIGTLFFLWPVIIIFILHSFDFVGESFRVGERSEAPMGLPFRWAIKSIIPIGFFFLFLGSVARLIRAFNNLTSILRKN